uniref:Uncharacterized protein n=1 Tax=Setaria italica TaxID=4555 RepID=K3Z9Z1_SETIT
MSKEKQVPERTTMFLHIPGPDIGDKCNAIVGPVLIVGGGRRRTPFLVGAFRRRAPLLGFPVLGRQVDAGLFSRRLRRAVVQRAPVGHRRHPRLLSVPYLGAEGAVVHRRVRAAVVHHECEVVVLGILVDFVANCCWVLDREGDVRGGDADEDGGRDGVHHQASYQGYKYDVLVAPFSGRRDLDRHGR